MGREALTGGRVALLEVVWYNNNCISSITFVMLLHFLNVSSAVIKHVCVPLSTRESHSRC